MAKAKKELAIEEAAQFLDGPYSHENQPVKMCALDLVWGLVELTEAVKFELINQAADEPVEDLEALQRKACGAYFLANLLKQYQDNVLDKALGPRIRS